MMSLNLNDDEVISSNLIESLPITPLSCDDENVDDMPKYSYIG